MDDGGFNTAYGTAPAGGCTGNRCSLFWAFPGSEALRR